MQVLQETHPCSVLILPLLPDEIQKLSHRPAMDMSIASAALSATCLLLYSETEGESICAC